MPGLTNRRRSIQSGQDWSKSTKGYKGGGEVLGYKNGGKVKKSKKMYGG